MHACNNQCRGVKAGLTAWARRAGLLVCVLASSSLHAADLQKAAVEGGGHTAQSIQQAAEQGIAEAQFKLGVMFVNGDGIAGDDAQAVHWYRQAAEQGHADAQANLGFMYGTGRGIDRDDAQAVHWYRQAAEQGQAVAQTNLGIMYGNGHGVERDDAQAVHWYRQAAEQGHANAQYYLAAAYEKGRGVTGDDAKAAHWYRQAAEQGHVYAQTNLGWMYEHGRGVPGDYTQAVHWYRRAAEQGNVNAQNNLGAMYASGHGVQGNYAWAVYWQALSAQQGNTVASGRIRENLQNLTALRVARPSINVRAKPDTDSDVLLKLTSNTQVYSLNLDNGWREVYIPQGHTVGYISDALLTAANAAPRRAASVGSDSFPARPAPRAGYVTCNTRCNNADCYRTYSDGRQVRFQARQVWDPFTNAFKLDSGSC